MSRADIKFQATFNHKGKTMNIRASLIGIFITGTAFGGELNVQGGSSTGGNSQVIVGRLNGACRFSVTGAFNDTVTVTFGPLGGSGGFTRTIRDLAQGRVPALQTYGVEQLPDGQTRILLGVDRATAIFNGGTVTLRRGTAVIDSDPIIIR
jgi:hypothetical protein